MIKDHPLERRLDNSALELLASKCPGLQQLHLEGCRLSYGLDTLLDMCKELKALKFRNCVSFWGDAFGGTNGTSAMEVVELVECHLLDKHVRGLAMACPALRELGWALMGTQASGT